MYTYHYDGSFDGLLTVIFKAYKNRQNLKRVSVVTPQFTLGFIETGTIYISTEYEKARKVEKSICENVSIQFFHDMKICFLSCNKDKDTAIVHTVYKVMTLGEGVLDSMDEYAFLMKRAIKQVLSERHRYLGLVRFREITDGTLFSTIEPKNNVLPILLSHFKERLKTENFAIFDKKRGMLAYYNLKNFELFFMDDVKAEWSNEEKEYNILWNIFHKSISIRERKNKKLQQGNLPKYYWRHLVENMEEDRQGHS